MDLLDKYPQAKKEFATWFMGKYNLTMYSFDEAPFVHQCISISRCFGYTVDIEQWSIKQLEDHVNNILYLYEDISKKYPDGVPDVFNDLRKMDFQQRAIEYAFLDKPADISHGLNEAIIDLLKPVMGKHNRLSLQDAITAIKIETMTIAEGEYQSEENLIQRKDEDIPF